MIVKHRDSRSFVMADIPGIIEGASEGKGLGHRFLKHIERNACLLFLIPADSLDYRKEYDTLLAELEKFNSEMLFKKRLVVISKSDFLDEELKSDIRREMQGIELMFISAVAQQGLVELKDALWQIIQENRQQ